MKILLIANYVPDRQESMQRFSASLSAALQQAGHEVRILRPEPLAVKIFRSSRAEKWLGYIDKLLLFPFKLKASAPWADIVHICDHSNSFYVRLLSDRPHVVTCHDLLAVRSALGEMAQNRTGWTGRRLQQMILNGLNRACHVVCDSEATRSDVLRLCNLPRERVSAIHLALNYPYSPMALEEAASRARQMGVNVSEPFILHVGGNQWYKNRLGVLQLFSLLRERTTAVPKLIMVGRPWTAEMHRFSAEHSLQGAAMELTDVSNEDLRALYSTAEFLIFPSFAEGFGWPILEAQACGCPVVTSNRASLPELGGDSAIYIDPSDHHSAVSTILSSLATLREAREAGLRNVRRFDSATMASRYLKLYGHLTASYSQESRHETCLPPVSEADSRSSSVSS